MSTEEQQPAIEEPPLVQLSFGSPSGESVFSLPNCPAGEMVTSLKSVLQSVVGFAQHSNYRLQSCDTFQDKASVSAPSLTQPKISPADGTVNTTTIPAHSSDTPIILSPFATLQEHAGLPDTCKLQVTLERYDVKTAQQHVKRFRDLLANPPTVQPTKSAKKDDKKDNKDAKNEEEVSMTPEDRLKSSKSRLPPKTLSAPNASPSLENAMGHFSGSASSLFPKSKQPKTNPRRSAEYESLQKVSVSYSGFNPPPPPRRLAGDLFYLEVKTATGTLNVTASPTGFYVNRNDAVTKTFSPGPAKAAAFSHDLLSLVLSSDDKFAQSYKKVLDLFQKPSPSPSSSYESPLITIANEIALHSAENDAVLAVPSWLVPPPQPHKFSAERAEDTLTDTFGMEDAGLLRDWNEELQGAREMATADPDERLLRARLIHKVLSEFSEAAVQGVVAISHGQIQSMNANETKTHQVYVYNGIFFSTAGDTPDTFRVVKGEAACRKSVAKDVQAMGQLNEVDNQAGLCTFATTLVDYLGYRFVAQSIAPGILNFDAHSEDSKFLQHGAVEFDKPLKTTDEMQTLFNDTFAGAPFNLPLRQTKTAGIRAPIEAKGISGSDGRKYILDLPRLTPRDANWIGTEVGGTGLLVEGDEESCEESWSAHTLRPELLARIKDFQLQEAMAERKEKRNEDLKKAVESATGEKTDEEKKTLLLKEREEIVKSYQADEKEQEKKLAHQYNCNVFYPVVDSYLSEDEKDKAIWKADEEIAKDAAKFLFEKMIPLLNEQIAKGSQIPYDGAGITELFHSMGINMRYLGIVAKDAIAKIPADHNAKAPFSKMSKIMPPAWIQGLECEMVARSAKHVLDRLMAECPLQCGGAVAAVLSAIVSVDSESGGEKPSVASNPNGGSACAPEPPTYEEVWAEIRADVKSRFRYELTTTPAENERAIPVLRRVCQRSGIRLRTKKYAFDGGQKSRCGFNSPVSSEDLYEIVPMVKNAASYKQPWLGSHCVGSSTSGCWNVVLLPEARNGVELARQYLMGNRPQEAYMYAEQANALMQEVVGHLHPDVVVCMDMQALVLSHFGELSAAIQMSSRALLTSAQLYGVDSSQLINGHSQLSSLLAQTGQVDAAIQHLEVASKLVGYCAGQNHPEIASFNVQIAAMLSDTCGRNDLALEFAEKVLGDEFHADVFNKLKVVQFAAKLCDSVGRYDDACSYEKEAWERHVAFLGKDHEKARSGVENLQAYMRKKVTLNLENEKNKEAISERNARELIMAEEGGGKKKKKKKSGSKKSGGAKDQ